MKWKDILNDIWRKFKKSGVPVETTETRLPFDLCYNCGKPSSEHQYDTDNCPTGKSSFGFMSESGMTRAEEDIYFKKQEDDKTGPADHVCGEGDDGNPSCEHAQHQHAPDKFVEVYNRGMSPGAPQGKRPSKDKNFLDMADLVAQRSNCRRRHFGAVVVKDGQVISTGYNGTPFNVTNCIDGGCSRCADADAGKVKPGEGYDRCICVHGEVNAVLQLARHNGGGKGAILYTQGAPCISCLKELVQAGIVEIVYRQQSEYRDRPEIQFAYDVVVRESGIKMRKSEE